MQVYLFDIDGTLLNTGGAGQAAMEAAIRLVLDATRPIHGVTYAGRTDRGIIHDIFTYYDVEPAPELRDRFIATYLDELPKALAERDGLILPGVVELLSHLHERDDVTLGLLTGNLLAGARIKLQHHGLAGFFDFAIGAFGDDHHDRNDVARRAWEAVCREVSDATISPGDVWIIGDTPADIRCARAIGANVLTVATGIYSEEELAACRPDRLVANFADAETMLGVL